MIWLKVNEDRAEKRKREEEEEGDSTVRILALKRGLA